MKKTSIALLFTVLITASCVFASCNAYGTDPTEPDETGGYESTIRELEDRILQLQRDQFIANSTREEQITKLEGMIAQLKDQASGRPSTSPMESESESESGSDETESDQTSESESTAEFLYTVADGVATITGYTGNESSLTLPSQIDGYNVVSISDDAFSSDTLNTVVIPDGVTNIGWFAFNACDSLYSVTIPDSVTSIGYNAFPRSTELNIICSEGSFAAKYAESYGIKVTLI